eukprot:scaffold223969_cov30-Tisochrysis_lutea.AAC.2
MSLEEWLKFVAATNMLYEGVGITPGDTSMCGGYPSLPNARHLVISTTYSASAELHPPDRDGLTSDTASLLFVASRTFVTDEVCMPPTLGHAHFGSSTTGPAHEIASHCAVKSSCR